MVASYFGIGTTLANIVNFETYFGEAPNVQPGDAIPLIAPNKLRTDSGKARRNGFVTVPAKWESVYQTELRTFIYAIFGGYTVASVQVYVTWIGEDGYYSPFLCEIDRPVIGQDYQLSASGFFVEGLQMQLTNPVLQSVTKTAATYTVTTSDKLVYGDTTSNTITLTLPALAGVTADTVYSFQKTATANSLVLDGSGAETVNGTATHTLTALNARVDIVKDGAANWKIVTVV